MIARKERIDRRLDRLEDRLPALPAAGLRLQRTIASRGRSMAADLARTWWESLGGTVERAGTAASSVGGTARDAGERARDAVTTAARRVAGQPEVEVRDVVDHAEEEEVDAAKTTGQEGERAVSDAARPDDAVSVAADPDRVPTGEAYEQLRKDELYRRATALEIPGRSRMTKRELISAIVAAEGSEGDRDV